MHTADQNIFLINFRRPFVTPRVLAQAQRESSRYEEEDFEEEEEELKPNRDHFVQDPALLREQSQQRREAKWGPPRQQGPPRGDVVGKYYTQLFFLHLN